MKKLTYYTCVMDNESVNEGGKVRDQAIKNWLEKRQNIKIKFEYLKTNKINKLINIIKYFKLLYKRDEIIFLQYPCTGLPILTGGMLEKIIRMTYIKILKIISKYNKLYFDIADLPYEQSIDLNLKKLDRKGIEFQEYTISKLKNTDLIFASDAMKSYFVEKYKCESNTIVCVNGGIDITQIELRTKIEEKMSKYIDKDKVNYIYAGTLNKGRQIEDIIKNFPENDYVKLILIGCGGEWLKEELHRENIIYLGSFTQEEAIILTSLCDIGLIPYDSDKKYYNIAFPTKLSFYIVAKVPFICTEVKEVTDINQNDNLGYISSIQNWNEIIKKLTKDEISEKRINIERVSENYLWENILDKIDLEVKLQ